MKKEILSYPRSRKGQLWFLLLCAALILATAIISALLQSSGGRVKIVQVSGESNTGVKNAVTIDGKEGTYAVNGYVASGLLYIPQNAYSAPAPGIVMTHGAFNNKEMQEAFAIEMARRGYVVICVESPNHGDNDDPADDYAGEFMLSAAKYLYNLTDSSGNHLVDPDRIGVSGHSMGGYYTNAALQLDGVDTTGADFEGATQEALEAGYHLGFFSAGIPEANDPDNACYGSNMIGVGVIKGSADEWYYNSEMKSPEYIMISKDMMTQDIFNAGADGTYQAVYAYNPTSFSMQWSGSIDGKLYTKRGSEYIAVDNSMKFDRGTQYYKYDTHGNSIYWLRSAEAMAFVDSGFDKETFSGDAYSVQNRGVYNFATGQLIDDTQQDGALLSIATGGARQWSEEGEQLRAVYEARETHPMNHFSVASTANYIDFYYNVFGIPEGSRFISPNNQLWIIKQCLSFFGFLGMFGLIIALADILLDTRLYASLKAEEGAITEPVAFTKDGIRKHISYWFLGIATCVFGAYSYSQINNNGRWYANSFLYDVIQSNVLKITSEEYYCFHNVGMIAYWGIVCGMFAVITTAVVWFVNHLINMALYGEDCADHDEHPFDAFRIRGWMYAAKTIGLVTTICTVFFALVQFMWKLWSVGFYFWTFGLRHFNADKIPSFLRYVPFFAVYYLVNAALGKNYRIKNLPEWATTIINVAFNIAGVLILVWAHNNHNLTYGNMTQYGNSLMYLLSYPVIPCVAFATVIGRRLYLRTGSCWLGGLINVTVMTITACANTGFTGMV